tara:strand:+ start:96 stop:1454 length:1359 start_codon:yes stop_codon:yes gene_type:complete
MKIIYLFLDAISYEDSWLKENTKMKNLKDFAKHSLNFHNHYSVTHNTIGNSGALLSGLSPTLTGVIGRTNGFENNKYGYLQQDLKKIDCSTHFMTPTKFLFSSDKSYKIHFDEFTSLSSSMADYRVCAKNLNEQHYFRKVDELNVLENYFLGLHYIDCHEPYESPISYKLINKKLFPNIWDFLFTYENIFYRIPRRFLRLYIKPSTILKNIYTFKEYPNLKNLKPKCFGPLLSPERYSNFYKRCWENESLYNEFLQMKLLAHEYLDEQIAKFLNYVKKNSPKDTIIFFSSDHGNNGVLSPNYLEKNGLLNELNTHIPLSIITFDEEIKKKFNLEGNIKIYSSHTDFYNTALRLYDFSVKENEFEKNLLSMSNQERFIISEIQDIKKNKAQTRLVSQDQLIDLRIKPMKNFKNWLLYRKEDLLNNVSEKEFNIYVNYKKKYNDYFSKRINQMS